MRHRKKSEKFSRPRSQRKALVKSLTRAMIINERITTTTSRAKYLRSRVDRLISWAKKNSIFHRRLAFRILEDHTLVKRLFDEIGPRFKNIEGGYSRVLSIGNRKGDGSKLSIIELTKIEKKESSKKNKKDNQKQDKAVPKKEEVKEKKGIVAGVKKLLKKKKETH